MLEPRLRRALGDLMDCGGVGRLLARCSFVCGRKEAFGFEALQLGLAQGDFTVEAGEGMPGFAAGGEGLACSTETLQVRGALVQGVKAHAMARFSHLRNR